MKKSEERLKKDLDSLYLTDTEKASMRVALGDYMRAHPSKVEGYSWFPRFPVLRFATPVLAAVLLCGSTAYAAQGALPGDLLYPVKIHVNESVELALATTPKAKATVEVELAETRVMEAQTLAARGTLTATTSQELDNNFQADANEAITLAAEVDAQQNTSLATATPPTATTTVAMATATSTRLFSHTSYKREQPSLVSQLQTSLNAQAGILNGFLQKEPEGYIEGTTTVSTDSRPDKNYRQHRESWSEATSTPAHMPSTSTVPTTTVATSTSILPIVAVPVTTNTTLITTTSSSTKTAPPISTSSQSNGIVEPVIQKLPTL